MAGLTAVRGGGEPAIPDPAYLMDAVQIGSAITFDSDIGVISGSLLPRSGGSSGNPLGVVLANQALTVTASLASHDNEGATTNGWMANLHVLVSSGGTGLSILNIHRMIRHGQRWGHLRLTPQRWMLNLSPEPAP